MSGQAPPLSNAQAPRRRRGFLGRLIRWLFLLLFLGAVGFFAYVYFYPVPDHEIFRFVPKDAIFVLESDDPIEDWKDFSDTEVWKHLKKNSLFADIEGDANYLDTLIRDNDKIFGLISGKKLLIVAQMVQRDAYDFLYVMDLKKGAKIALFMDLFEDVLNAFDVKMRKERVEGHEIFYIGEPKAEVLLGFEGNILLASFSEKLLLNGFASHNHPYYSENPSFIELRKDAYRQEGRGSLMKFHLNFDQLDEFMGTLMDDVGSTVTSISEALEYSSFDLKMRDDFVELVGYTSVVRGEQSMPEVLCGISPAEVRAQNVLPSSTSFFFAIDFGDFNAFYDSIGRVMKNDAGYIEYEKTKDQLGKLLGVSKSDKKVERKKRRGKDIDYFDWIGQEIALAMLPVDSFGSKQAYVALFHIPDKENAEHDLRELDRKIRNRTPVRFEEYTYKGKQISYLAMKGFFKLFLGRLFNKFDQPKYTILDEFVVFSNDTTAIHQIIDVVNGDKPNLPNDGAFRDFFNRFDSRSNYFVYLNSHNFYPHLPSLGSPETAAGIRKNEAYITCFPKGGLQLVAEDGRFEARLYMDFDTTARKAWWENP